MPHQAVVLWKSVVQQLQRMATLTPQQQQVAAACKIEQQLDVLATLGNPLPRAVWKQLINDVQVPKQLAALCSKYQLDANSSSSSSRDPQYIVSLTVWKVFKFLMDAVFDELVTDYSFRVQKDSSKSLTRSITQQLQSNGLLQKIPDVMQAAANLQQQLPVPDTTASTAAATVAGAGAGAAAARSSSSQADGTTGGNSPAVMRHANLLTIVMGLLAAAPAVALLQHSQSDLLLTMDAAACLALAFMRHLTAVLAAMPTGPPPAYAAHYSAAAGCCIRLLCAWSGSAAQNASSLQQPSTAAAAVSLLAFSTYAQSLVPASFKEGVSSPACHGGKYQAGSASVAAAATAAAAHAVTQVSERLEQHGMLHWLQEAMQQQLQDAFPGVGADLCWLVTGGVSMQAAAWAGACGVDLLQKGLPDTIRAAAAVQHRCCNEVQQPGQQQQQQLRQSSMPWLTQLKDTATQQPHNSLLLSQLLLCSVDQFCSNGAAAPDVLAGMLTALRSAAELANCAGSFTVLHQEAAEQEYFDLLTVWLEPVLPATLRLLSQAVQLLDQADSRPAGSSSSSTGSAILPSLTETEEQACVLLLLQLLVTTNHYTCVPVEPGTVADHWAATAMGLLPPLVGGFALDDVYAAAPAWETHNAELSRVLEGLLRVLGRHPVHEFTTKVVLAVTALLLPTHNDVSALRLAYVKDFRADGPGSPAQLQLFSMLCSLLKVGSLVRPVHQSAADTDCACWGAGDVANLLASESRFHLRDGAALQPLPEGLSSQPSAAAVEGLLWLVLAGRCCLQWTAALKQLLGRSDLWQLLMQLQQLQMQLQQLQGESGPGWASALGLAPCVMHTGTFHAAIAVFDGPQPMAMTLLSNCLQWLQQEAVDGQLAAAGYPTEALMQQLQAVLDVVMEPVNAAGAAAAVTAFGVLVQRLQALGVALNTLAVPHACNNPACTTLAGPTELAAVSRRSCMCAGCRVARYCSRGCQTQHWKQHKPVCRALAGAAVAEQGKA